MHQLHIPVAQAPANAVNGPDPVNNGGGRSDGDERIHIGCPVPKSFEAAGEIFVVDRYDWQAEKQLGKRKNHGVFVAEKNSRQRPAHHMAHGQVKKRDEKRKRYDQPALYAG